MSETLSIVIPAYNEERTIHRILDKVKAVELLGGIQKELMNSPLPAAAASPAPSAETLPTTSESTPAAATEPSPAQ